jgi:ligand-binding SRPBCC domain-containing protein
MSRGTRIDYQLSLVGIPVYWRTVISEWEPPFRFIDEQEAGPFEYWRHEHRFEDHGQFVTMVDQVTYQEPLGWLGAAAHHVFVGRLLDKVFDHRATAMEAHLRQTGRQTSP